MNSAPNDKTTIGADTAKLKRLLQIEKKLSPQLRAKMELEAKNFIDYLMNADGKWTHAASSAAKFEVAKKK